MALTGNDTYIEIGLILKENVIFRKVGCKPLIYARACACVVFDVVVGRDRRVARLVVQGRFSARTTICYIAWPRSQRDRVRDLYRLPYPT